MTVEAYLHRLAECLAPLPEQERVAALSYYDEFFIEAGKEDAQAVMEKLGPPEQVAASILADYKGMTPGTAVPQEEATVESGQSRPVGRVLLLICLSPIWLSLLVTAGCLVLTVVLVMASFLVAGAACVFAAVAAGPMGLLAGLTGAANILLTIGAALGVGGAGLVLFALGLLLVKAVPASFRAVGWLCRWLFGRRREE
jgi:uncharacterized membrane protein